MLVSQHRQNERKQLINVTVIFYRIIIICIVIFTFSFLLLLLTAVNPYTVGMLDSAILQAPCDMKEEAAEKDRRIEHTLWKFASIALRRTGYFEDRNSPCIFSQNYKRARCHMSIDGVYLKRFNKWNQCRIANFSIHSESACNYNIESIGSRRFLSPYFLLDRERTYNVLLSSLTGQNVKNRSPSAIEIKDLNINWHSLFKPVIDVNASGIVLNVVTRKDPLHIGHSTIGLTIPMTTVGGWGIDELIDMKPPPPPDEEGLYPRMGTINLTDARILSHVVKDDVVTVNEIKIPDAFFYPLFQLTQLAGINGTDQKVVEEVIKRSILMVIEKQVLNDDELLSKTMKTFLESVQKSSEFVHEMNQFIQQKVQEWSGSIEDNVFKADKALNRYLEKIETDWSTILNDDKNPFVKFSKDMKEVGQKIIDDAEIKLNTVILDEKSNMGPLLTKELKEAWNVVKKPLTEFESEINNFDQVFDKVKNEVMDGFMNAKQKFSNFMDDTRMKKRV